MFCVRQETIDVQENTNLSPIFFTRRTMKSIVIASVMTLLLSLPAYGQKIPVTVCGADLNLEGGKYVLTQDIGPSAGNGVNITANNVKFDLNGFTITGSGGSIGINVTGSGAHISGGTVSTFETGILLQGGSGHHVHGMTVTRYDGGIELLGSDDNHLHDNIVTNGEFGIALNYSDNNHLDDNHIRSHFYSGVQLFDSHFNHFTGNESRSTIVGSGFELMMSDDNVFTSNRGIGNDGSGFWVRMSANNSLRDNTADSNFIAGIELSSSSNNTVQNNTASRNRLTGIFLGLSDNNTIKGNTATGNFFEDGIALVISSGNVVKSNTALNNGGFDLFDNNCPFNLWRNNFFVTSFGPCVD